MSYSLLHPTLARPQLAAEFGGERLIWAGGRLSRGAGAPNPLCSRRIGGITRREHGIMKPERMTEDLLQRLLAATDVDEYLDEESLPDRTLAGYLAQLLADRRITRADVVRASGLNPTFVYDIFAGKSKPGRDHAIMLAFGLSCSLRETQRLLRLAGASELWCKLRRDAIVIWCIQNGLTREQTDDELWAKGEKTLLTR